MDVEPSKPASPGAARGKTLHDPRAIASRPSCRPAGAGLTHFCLTDARYAQSDGRDVSTTPDVERWRNLRTLFRDARRSRRRRTTRSSSTASSGSSTRRRGVGQGLPVSPTRTRRSSVVKTVTAGERPFELTVETTLTNLADAPKKHAASIEVFAYRTNEEVKGKLGRVSPFLTSLECARADEVKRLAQGRERVQDAAGSREPLDDRYAAISNYYFAQAIVPARRPRRASAATSRRATCSPSSGTARASSPDDDAGRRHLPRASAVPAAHPRRRTSRRRTGKSPSSAPRSATSSSRAAGGMAAPAGPHQPGHVLDRRQVPGGDHHLDPRAHHGRQLGPGDHRPDGRPAHRALPADLEADPERHRDAPAQARDRRPQREVQGRPAGQERRDDGALAQEQGQPARRVPAGARADADLVRALRDPADGGGVLPHEVLVVRRTSRRPTSSSSCRSSSARR